MAAQSTTTTQAPPDWLQPYWQNYLSGTQNAINGTNFSPYSGPTVAPWNFLQNSAADMAYNYATGGTPAGNMANAQIVNQASGATVNPYATVQNPYQGASNSFLGQTNPYAGDNPYLQSQIDQSNADISKAYAQGTAAQTDSAFNQAGAYGGSAYQNQVANNQNMLAKNLAQNTTNLRYQNYLNSGQLANSDLARNASLAQQGIALNAGLADNTLNRATNAFQNQQQNALQGAQLGLQSQGIDQSAINSLFGMGLQQQGNTQNILDAMQRFYTGQQQAPFVPLDLMGNALSRASGAYGTSTSSLNPGSPSWLNYLGLIGGIGSLFGG